jgi:hypothetical protein
MKKVTFSTPKSGNEVLFSNVTPARYYKTVQRGSVGFITRPEYGLGNYIIRAFSAITTGNGYSGGFQSDTLSGLIKILLDKGFEVFELETKEDFLKSVLGQEVPQKKVVLEYSNQEIEACRATEEKYYGIQLFKTKGFISKDFYFDSPFRIVWNNAKNAGGFNIDTYKNKILTEVLYHFHNAYKENTQIFEFNSPEELLKWVATKE